ncbi:MAG: hypothetical protein LN563_02550 [Rickettsia endosymbiont of Platyusa sonomae]|nr:hypothetical protein [Rickettsia endosymbiont of Platyusa sonomae]
MMTNIKTQQQSKFTCRRKNCNNTTSNNTSETNDIISDLILELKQTQNELELAHLAHKDFIKKIAIDIKTSCAEILLLTKAFYEGENNPTKKKNINNITNDVEKVIAYCSDMVDFAKYYYNGSSTTTTNVIPPISMVSEN